MRKINTEKQKEGVNVIAVIIVGIIATTVLVGMLVIVKIISFFCGKAPITKFVDYSANVLILFMAGLLILSASILVCYVLIKSDGKLSWKEDKTMIGVMTMITIVGVAFFIGGMMGISKVMRDIPYVFNPEKVCIYNYSMGKHFHRRGLSDYWVQGVDATGEEYTLYSTYPYLKKVSNSNRTELIIEYLPNTNILINIE